MKPRAHHSRKCMKSLIWVIVLKFTATKILPKSLLLFQTVFNIEAKIIGRCEPHTTKKLTIAGIEY